MNHQNLAENWNRHRATEAMRLASDFWDAMGMLLHFWKRSSTNDFSSCIKYHHLDQPFNLFWIYILLFIYYSFYYIKWWVFNIRIYLFLKVFYWINNFHGLKYIPRKYFLKHLSTVSRLELDYLSIYHSNIDILKYNIVF